MKNEISINDFDYDLPEDRIPKFPSERRQGSQLLIFEDGEIQDAHFPEIVNNIKPGSQIVFNNTKVIQARILFLKPGMQKPIEVFCLEPIDLDVQQAMATKGSVDYLCLVGRAKKWKEETLEIAMEGVTLSAQKLERLDNGFKIRLSWDADLSFAEILELAGHTPLPPYLNRQDEVSDKDRYQTVYAESNGSVAAPTAGLHFTPAIIEEIKKEHSISYVTLHVGAGTFKPVQSDSVADHDMHFEEIHVSRQLLEELHKHDGHRTAVGTTSVRTLESLYWIGVRALEGKSLKALHQWDAYELPSSYSQKEALGALLDSMQGDHLFFKTQLMITPGYTFKMVQSIVTNFHQPKSTLLLLVGAATKNRWKQIYNHALQNNYRFLSYGDSSIIHIA